MTKIEKKGLAFLGIYLSLLSFIVLTAKIGANRQGRPYYQREWAEIWNLMPSILVLTLIPTTVIFLALVYRKKI